MITRLSMYSCQIGTKGNYNQMNSAPQLPSYLGLPFKILVSPFVNFNPETRTTDILMFNSRNLGALIVAEDPHVKTRSRHPAEPQTPRAYAGLEAEGFASWCLMSERQLNRWLIVTR